MSDNALAVTGIVKKFGTHLAVEDMSFEVPRGLVYGILGPNGAGKTTTLRMINDIIAPDRGDIVILGNLRPGLEAAYAAQSVALGALDSIASAQAVEVVSQPSA